MLEPTGVFIDSLEGKLSEQTGMYSKRLSEFADVYADATAFNFKVQRESDPVIYEVREFRQSGSDIFFGTTTMMPGTVGDEFFMTRGHFHSNREMGEIYYTQSGKGVLLLISRTGENRVVEMKPGVCAFIPPDWAHRSINTGKEKLVFVWCCNQEAGHDYGQIRERGMGKRIFESGEGYLLTSDNET